MYANSSCGEVRLNMQTRRRRLRSAVPGLPGATRRPRSPGGDLGFVACGV